MYETIFRFVALALLAMMKVIRWRTAKRADEKGARDAWQRNSADTMLLLPITILMQLSIVVYAFFPRLLSWAHFPFPIWIRWLGVAMSVGALCLLAWADHHLGKNFSMTVRIREGHTLVTRGPYRWIRHPIYTAGLLFSAAIFLVSANWFVGFCWIGGCSLLYACRIPREEALMLEEFDDEYRAYINRTGRLLPPWRH